MLISLRSRIAMSYSTTSFSDINQETNQKRAAVETG